MYSSGDILDQKYEVIVALGEGGFGKVFLARDKLLRERLVAIKVMKDEDADRQKALIKEMEFLARLNNPAVVSFYHYLYQGSRLHLVMEYCAGGNLRQIAIKTSAIEPNTAFQWGITVADVISFVHKHGIVHHDVKPENILFTLDGNLKISDFGVANQNLGTPVYMPPEAFTDDRVSVADPRADVYALGITLLELIAGENPLFAFRGRELLAAKLRHDFLPTDKPRWINDILWKATHPTPELRFQTMDDFREAMVAKSVPFIIDQKKMIAHELAEKAELLLMKKKWKDSWKFVEEALYSYEDSVKALVVAGRHRLRLNRIPEAKEYLDKAQRLNSRVEVQKELGWVNLEQGNYRQAISLLTDYLQRSSSDYEALNLLIQCYYETERYELAAELAATVAKKHSCFRNNYLISSILAGDLSVLASVNLEKEENSFIEYNAVIAREEDQSWQANSLVSLKSKLLFQDFRFGVQNRAKHENAISVRTSKKTIDMKKRIISIGRLDINDLVLKYSNVSRRHCAIINFPDDVWIYDLQSTQGTYVDDREVVKKQFLVGVHTIRLGTQEFRIASKHDLLL